MAHEAARSWLHTARIALRNLRGHKREPEIEFIARFVGDGDQCLHIGASDGRHTYEMSRLAGSGVVHCFEPSPYTHRILTRITRFHGLHNVRLHNVAIGSEPGETNLVTPIKRNGHLGRSFAFITDEVPSAETLAEQRQFRGFELARTPVWTVDDYCQREQIEPIAFVRCDVEGAELAMLEGARAVLERDHPTLLLEIHPHALRDQFGASAANVSDRLHDLGYVLFRVEGSRLVETPEVADEPWRDYFCIPPARLADVSREAG